LVRRALAVEAGRMKDIANVLGTWVRSNRLDRLRNAYSQNAALMEGLTQDGLIDAQITRHRVYVSLWPDADALGGRLNFVE